VKSGQETIVEQKTEKSKKLAFLQYASTQKSHARCTWIMTKLTKCRFFLSILERPSPPSKPKVLGTTARSIYVTWTPRFNGNAQITKYTVEIKLQTEDWGNVDKKEVQTNGLDVTELRPASTYDLRVYATNKVGMSDASPVITASTREAGKDFSLCSMLVTLSRWPCLLRSSSSPPPDHHLEGDVKELVKFEEKTEVGNRQRIIGQRVNVRALAAMCEFHSCYF